MDEELRDRLKRMIMEFHQPEDQWNKELIQKFFLSLPGINRILVEEVEELKHILDAIPTMIKYKEYEENDLIFRGTSKLSNLIIILDGEISLLEVRNETIECSLVEYMTLLFHLRKNMENELVEACYAANQNAFPSYEENFDTFLRNLSKGKCKNPIFLENLTIQDKASETIKSLKHEGNKKFTVQDYIKFYDMEKINKFNMIKMQEKRMVEIPKYYVKKVYTPGEILDLDMFTSTEKKEIMTAIVSKECKVATIDTNEYDSLLKSMNEKKKKKFLQVIYSSSLFRRVSSYLFEKKFFKYFKYKSISRGEYLFKEGDEAKMIYFLISGELEVYTHKNIIQLNNLIVDFKKILKDLQGIKNKYHMDDEEYEESKENMELLTNKSFLSEIENKTLFEAKKVRIGITDHREIIGVHDFVRMDTRNYIVTGKCLTQLEVYEISIDNFASICGEAKIEEQKNSFFLNKINLMLKRLNSHKSNLYEAIKKKDFDNRRVFLKMQSLESDSNRKNRLYSLESNTKLSQVGKNIISNTNLNYKRELENARRLRNPTDIDEEKVEEEKGKNERRFVSLNTEQSDLSRRSLIPKYDESNNYVNSHSRYRKAIVNRHLYDNLFHNYVLNTENKLTVDEHFDHRINECDNSAKVKCINLVDPLAFENFNERFCKAIAGFKSVNK